MALTFKQALDRSIAKEPDTAMFIHLYNVLQESGASRTEITKYFNKYMPKDDFDKDERKELIDNLVRISNPVID